MAIGWKEFQDVVARIEHGLAPKGAVVKCPDRIRDLVTGRLREVDASIRFTIGSTPILITVECRKRSKIQDDTWIEQLATKRQKLGAAKTIAVVPSGFSKSAVTSASMYGIELRSLDELTSESIQAIAESLQVSAIELCWSRVQLKFVFNGTYPQPIESTLGVCNDETPIIRNSRDHRVITFEHLLRHVTSHLCDEEGKPVDLVKELVPDGPAERREISLRIQGGEWTSPTNRGDLEVTEIVVAAEFARVHRPVSISFAADYLRPEGRIARVTERTVDLGGDERLIVVALSDIRQPDAH